MASREDFMRQMGLTASDLKGPVEPAVSTRGAKRPTTKPEENVPSPTPARSAPQPQKSSATSQSKADFLRSLGIDNFAEPTQQTQAPAARNATGSQEYPKSEPVRQPPASGSFAKRRFNNEEDEEESSFRGAYTPKLREPQRDDFTLGRKPVPERAPATPVLDAELLGLSEGAGVEEVKNMGNRFFQAGDYRKAVRLYTRAIEMDGMNSALYSNRSAAYLLGGKQMGIDTRSMALRDADKAIKLKPTWFKGFSRRGDALFKMERYDEAYEAYEGALELDAGNAGIIHSMNELKPHVNSTAKKSSESVSWAAPGSSVLHSSVGSQSAVKTTEKSAYELLNEFQEERSRTTPHLGRGGEDYKAKQLEKYRTRGSTNDSRDEPAYEPEAPKPSGGVSKARDVPSEFSSDAARDYQAALLESYRKKKQRS